MNPDSGTNVCVIITSKCSYLATVESRDNDHQGIVILT